MFIFIFEDNEVMKTDNVTQEDKDSADDGILEIIDISNNENPKTYFENEWHEIEEIKNEE